MKLNEIIDCLGDSQIQLDEVAKPYWEIEGGQELGGINYPKYVKMPSGPPPVVKRIKAFSEDPDQPIEPDTINLKEIFTSILIKRRKGMSEPITTHIKQAFNGGSAGKVQLSNALLGTKAGMYDSYIREFLISELSSVYNNKILNEDGALAFTDYNWNSMKVSLEAHFASDDAVHAFTTNEVGNKTKIPMITKIIVPVDPKHPDIGNEFTMSELFAWTIVDYLKKVYAKIPARYTGTLKGKDNYVNDVKHMAEGLYGENAGSTAEVDAVKAPETPEEVEKLKDTPMPGDENYGGASNRMTNQDFHSDHSRL